MPEVMRYAQRGLRAALFLPFSMLLSSMGAFGAQSAADAWLESALAGDKLRITAFARGGPVLAARYELISEKAGTSGHSTTRQSGTLNLPCCEPVGLSQLSLGLNPGDRYTITLKLFAGSELLSEKVLVYPQ